MKTERNYKDRLIRMLFSKEKQNLLSLYNAVNHTNYTNEEDLTITTLENAIYLNMKNDISFVFDFYLNLYEHQSTLNKNMPLRDLFYLSKILQGLVADKDLYGNTLVKIPTPRFLVLYNGVENIPERMELRLSDAFEKPMKTPEIELCVTILNITPGNNPELLESCKLLKEYVLYVEKVRKYAKVMPLRDAVNQAVNECIQEGILKEFLTQNKAEAIEMSIFEYDEEAHLKNVRREGVEKGDWKRLISLIRKKLEKGWDTAQIAELLEETAEIVQVLVQLIQAHPQKSADELADLYLDYREKQRP